LLPSGKLPRIAVAVALVLAALLIANLLLVHSAKKSLLAANTLDLLMVLWASSCSFYIAQRSAGYARQIWSLLGTALGLETIAQAISGYYQSFVPGSAHVPWPSDVLFFLWVVPILMMFLPQSEGRLTGVDWLRVFDFAQITIVAATAYLYFFYIPSRWRADDASLLRQILILYIARDLLLSAGFFVRSRTSVSPWLKLFSLGMAAVFLFAAVPEGDYLLTLGSTVGRGSWGDVLWMVPYFLVIVLAAYWKQDERVPRPLVSSRSGDYAVSQILPVIIPLFVIFMGRTIAKEQFLVAWVAITASVLCSALRLVLTNEKQRRISLELLETAHALRTSEGILASAFRSSPDAYSITPFPGGPYLEVNEGFTRLTGYAREEALHKTPQELSLWINPSRRAELLAKLIEKNEVREEEFDFRRKDGEIRTGQMSATLVDLDGRRCALVAVRDVTARKEAEILLRSSEERFRTLVENLHVGIISYDGSGRIQFANQAIEDMLGMLRGALIGKTSTQLGLVPLREDGTPIPASLRPVAEVITTKRPIRSQLLGWRIPTTPEILWTLLDAVPECAPDGRLDRVIVSATNLTEQRRAVEALRESEERFRTLVRDLQIGVVLQGTDTRIQFANKAALDMFGFSEEEVLGKSPMELGVCPFDEKGKEMPESEWPVAVVVRTRAPVLRAVMAFRRPNAEQLLWIHGNAIPQFDAAGNILRVIASFADITEMKIAERAIHQLSTQLLKLQDEERRRIGRELHDGLAQTVLAINLSLAQARHSLNPENETALRSLEKARGLLQQMSREIRTLSYLLHPPLLDDLGLVSALKEYAKGFADRSGIATEFLVSERFPRMPQASETALFRIVQESLANIQRHSGSPTAQILLRQEDSVVTLEVRDFGRGIQGPLNGDPRRSQPRLGVGIPGMRERMAQLGGRLDIDSSAKGTTIRATIPQGVSPEVDDASASHSHRR
jgi:PAS domain S-box-containing protein